MSQFGSAIHAIGGIASLSSSSTNVRGDSIYDGAYREQLLQGGAISFVDHDDQEAVKAQVTQRLGDGLLSSDGTGSARCVTLRVPPATGDDEMVFAPVLEISLPRAMQVSAIRLIGDPFHLLMNASYSALTSELTSCGSQGADRLNALRLHDLSASGADATGLGAGLTEQTFNETAFSYQEAISGGLPAGLQLNATILSERSLRERAQ